MKIIKFSRWMLLTALLGCSSLGYLPPVPTESPSATLELRNTTTAWVSVRLYERADCRLGFGLMRELESVKPATPAERRILAGQQSTFQVWIETGRTVCSVDAISFTPAVDQRYVMVATADETSCRADIKRADQRNGAVELVTEPSVIHKKFIAPPVGPQICQ